MRKIIVVALFMFAFTVVFGLTSGSVLAKDKTVLLKIPLAYGTALPGLGTPGKYLAEKVPIVSNNSIQIKLYEPKKLIPPFEMLDAVSNGKITSCLAVSGYWAGKTGIVSNFFTAVPFGPEAPEYLAWMYYGNGLKLWQELYDRKDYNVKVLLCGILAPETSGWYKKEIKSANDLKGLPIRFFGLGGQALAKMGASVQLLPGGEIFGALEKNVIEGSEFSMPAVDTLLGFYKIAKYNYFPGWHQQATYTELLINKDVWNKMSVAQQTIMEEMSKAATLNNLAYCEAIQAKVMKENVEKRGVKNMYWSDEMLANFKKAWEEVAKEESAKDPFFKKVNDDLNAFRSEYKIWKDYGFLPRPKPNK